MSAQPESTPALVPAGGSGQMFDRIAHRYDLLNRILSLGMDHRWRRALVKSLDLGSCGPAPHVLDLATGTADVALAVAKAYPTARLVGVDPSPNMLDHGRVKARERNLDGRVELMVGDAQALPFADDNFDAACISFGIRNVPDRALGLREMRRVVRPGGVVSVLELGEPTGVMGPFARFYVHRVVPKVGAWLSGAREYDYLQKSIAAFPAPEAFAAMMREAGLQAVTVRRFNFGGTNLYVGRVAR